MAIVKTGPPINVPMYIPGTNPPVMSNSWVQWYNFIDQVTGGVSGLGGLADVDGEEAATGDTGLGGGLSSLHVDIEGLEQTTIADNDEIMFADTSDSGNLKKVQAADIAALGKGVLQIKQVTSTARTAITTPRFVSDDTVPQISEGTELLRLTLVPKSDASTLYIIAHLYGQRNATADKGWAAALFRDTSTEALTSSIAESGDYGTSAGGNTSLFFAETSRSGGVALTYTVRVGPIGTGTFTPNTNAVSGSIFGSNVASSLWVVEYEDPPETNTGTSESGLTITVSSEDIVNGLSGTNLDEVPIDTEDKVLIQDTSNEDVLAYVTVQSILDLVDIPDPGDSLSQEKVEDIAGGLVTGSTQTGITVTYDDSLGDINFEVNHDTALNYVADKHIDHTTVSMTAGEGLTGGGTIAANRSFALDFTDLSTTDTAIGSTDIISIHDGAQKKITWANTELSITNAANSLITGRSAATPAAADYIILSDTSDSGNLKKALVSDITGAGTDLQVAFQRSWMGV